MHHSELCITAAMHHSELYTTVSNASQGAMGACHAVACIQYQHRPSMSVHPPGLHQPQHPLALADART